MDLSHWAIVDVFTVEQAACLWVDKEPRLLYAGQHGREYSDAHAILQALTGAIVSGTLQADSSRNALHAIGDFRRSLVAREDLRAFAERKRQHPAFLFDTLLCEAESEGMKPQSLPREDADSGKVKGRSSPRIRLGCLHDRDHSTCQYAGWASSEASRSDRTNASVVREPVGKAAG